MKKNATKHALLMSALALLLCVSMLVGTTFAWFTDSVTSANNIINAGNLDIELYYQAEGQTGWTKVDAATNIFMEGALWEPGHTEVIKLKVVNEGSLALKYQLGVNIASEIGSFRVDGTEFKLSDYIKFAVIDGENDYSRDEAVAAAEDNGATELKIAYDSQVSTLLPAANAQTESADIVTMVVYMPTTVGNEANHATGQVQPSIKLGLNLFATQKDFEEDSFGKDYDSGLMAPTIKVGSTEEMKNAMENLTEPTVLDATGVELILNGRPAATFVDGVTIQGAVYKVEGSNTAVLTDGATSLNGKIVFKDCTFIASDFDGKTYFQSGQNATDTKLVFDNCTFKGCAYFADNTGGGVEFNNCKFELNDQGYAAVVCLGGNQTFNQCTFNISGSASFGLSTITKYGHLNLYSERCNTNVTLIGCDSVSVHKHNALGGAGSVVTK